MCQFEGAEQLAGHLSKVGGMPDEVARCRLTQLLAQQTVAHVRVHQTAHLRERSVVPLEPLAEPLDRVSRLLASPLAGHRQRRLAGHRGRCGRGAGSGMRLLLRRGARKSRTAQRHVRLVRNPLRRARRLACYRTPPINAGARRNA